MILINEYDIIKTDEGGVGMLHDYYDLKDLPVIDTGSRPMQVASFDRKEENGDWGQFLYKDADGAMVMLEENGAGCIRSFWAAVTTDDTEMKIYFDGEAEPRYVCSVRGFFNGAVPELCGPDNTFLERGQWAYGDCFCGNFFKPLYFERGIKITVTGSNLDFYYHILYERFKDNVKERLSAGVSEKMLSAFEGKYERPAEEYTVVKTLKLEHNYTDGYIADESGVVTEFCIEYDEGVDLSNVKIDFAFDNDPISKIACPITYLFAEPLGYTGIETIAAKSEKADGKIRMHCYLPMPYWKRISMCLVKFVGDPVELTIKLKIEENRYDPETTGHLYVNYRRGETELFEDWKLGEFYGRGHVVGLVQTCRGGQWCEGNEHFYIDGEISPSINGTGTEDLYLGCYWPNKKYDSPVAGCVNNILPPGETFAPDVDAGYYRFFHDMPIAFENGIVLTIQHGAVGQTYSYYSSSCFSYRLPHPSQRLTDLIDVSSASSRKLHEYTKIDDDALYTLSGKIEGDRNSAKLSRRGALHKSSFSFTAAIDKSNRGAVLRVLTDLSAGPASTEVRIDGEHVGYWLIPETNSHAPIGDSDFEIPEHFTNGKELLKVELIPKDVFAAFEFRIITRI